MEADGDLWQGIIRWRQNQKALKSGSRISSKVDHALQDSPQESSLSKLQHDLSKADRKSAHHLALPAKKERLIMGKLKLLGLILLFLLAGALFFVAGFLTCYTAFPPNQTSFSSYSPQGGPYGMSPESEGLARPPASHIISPSTSYASRQSLLNSAGRGHGNSNGRGSVFGNGELLHQAEQQTAYQAKRQAHNFITRTLSRWNMKLRSVFGYYAGSAIAPLTTDLAKRAVDAAIPLDRPNYQSSSKTGSKTGTAKKVGAGASAKGGMATLTDPGARTTPDEAKKAEAAGAAHSFSDNASGVGAPSSSSPHFYTILVQSFADSGEAFNLARELQSNGFGAYVAQEQSKSGIQFAVKVGQFPNYTDARNAAAILSQQWNRPARVVMIDSAAGH